MSLKFTKMHGLGNDFVVIDAIHQSLELHPKGIRQIANRHLGIGCDQVLIVESAEQMENDFHYRIFNSDGGEVEQCGNGVRCFARFVHDQGLTNKHSIRVETLAGVVIPELQANGEVQVDMGIPHFEPSRIPIAQDEQQTQYSLAINGGQTVTFSALSVGNPHAIIQVNSTDNAEVAILGPILESHPFFPQRINVGFCEVIDRHNLRLRVFERGVGETQACGTGACAAMVASRELGLINNNVSVHLNGGTLNIQWLGKNSAIMMTGPATSVFDGQISREDLNL